MQGEELSASFSNQKQPNFPQRVGAWQTTDGSYCLQIGLPAFITWQPF